MRRSSSQRGFTLAEMAVSLGVTAIVLTAVLATFTIQQRAYHSSELGRRSAEASRDGLLELQRSLRLAGLGVDPGVAFDFEWYSCATPGTCRDHVDAPDELVFVARNPNYRLVPAGQNVSTTPPSTCASADGCLDGNAWDVAGITTTGTTPTVTIKARAGQRFAAGTQLLFVCAGAARSTMGRVAYTSPVANPTPLAADAAVTLALVPTPATPASPNAPDPFLANDFTASCFVRPGVGAFVVDRSRYFIEPDIGGKPWLMLDTGQDLNGNLVLPDDPSSPDTSDLLPIAAGVEDLQVAYVMLNGARYGRAATDSDADFQVGDVPGTQEEPNPRLGASLSPQYADASNEPRRFNLHPGNIRAVRVSLVVRHEQSEPARGPTVLAPPENRTAIYPATHHYQRTLTRSLVQVRNLEARSLAIF